LVKKHAAFKSKDAISGFPVSPGSAEALVMSGGKIKYILIAHFLGNICAKNCRNRTMYVKIITSCKGGTFFETQCIFGWAAITLGIGPHSTLNCNSLLTHNKCDYSQFDEQTFLVTIIYRAKCSQTLHTVAAVRGTHRRTMTVFCEPMRLQCRSEFRGWQLHAAADALTRMRQAASRTDDREFSCDLWVQVVTCYVLHGPLSHWQQLPTKCRRVPSGLWPSLLTNHLANRRCMAEKRIACSVTWSCQSSSSVSRPKINVI